MEQRRFHEKTSTFSYKSKLHEGAATAKIIFSISAVTPSIGKEGINENDVHIQMQHDNTTTVAYINSKGGSKSPLCNRIAK